MIQPLTHTRAALLVVDIQERLVPAMPEAALAQVIKNTRILITAARTLHLPIVVSQQYPKGLGPTIAPIEDALDGAAVHRFDKLEFSAEAAPGSPRSCRSSAAISGSCAGWRRTCASIKPCADS